ncbi:MAG TPA: hypothetical protein VGF43_17045 [Dongiaceae bacterium]|jgi:hypothetical protein
MTNRVQLWLGASALALASGALPAAPIFSPIAVDVLGIDPPGQAWAQESVDESGEGTASKCADDGAEEGGSSACAGADDTSSGEDGEGEG